MKSKTDLFANLRKDRGFSQGEIALKLNISRPTYVLIEKGSKELTVGQAKILSDIYDVSPDDLRLGKISQKKISEKEIVAAQMPTKFGIFQCYVWNQKKGEEIVFLTTPKLDPSKPVLVRVHSECLTGDMFHSYRCDCGEQKERALEMINESGNGVFIYLRQEGRGIGLYEKVKAYVLQDQGYDTHEANILLGHKPDYREYSWVKKVLDYLNVSTIKLITNNPSKISEISLLGITISERISLVVESNSYNRKYFETKKQKFKHFFGNEESNYFYQFSYAETKEQIEEVGKFLANKQKDPLLKICIGIHADSYTFEDKSALKNIELMWKATEHFEGFVPILHFTFKSSVDPKKDISKIREKMPYVKYLRLNDLASDYLEILSYANKFFLTDIPISDDLMYLFDNPKFVQEVLDKKTFIMLDNSHGRGVSDSENNIMKKIDKSLSVGINDIAICGGFGPGDLAKYFKLREHYKINFSIDAETKLKTKGVIDMKKVKEYLSELISHNYK